MSDVIAFLKARTDEDEAAALAASCAGTGKYGGRPHWSATDGIVIDAEDPDWAVVDLGPCIEDPRLSDHIARHDPARTLREVEAKRVILGWHRPTPPHPEFGYTYPAAAGFCGYDGPGDNWQAEQEPDHYPDAVWPCLTVRLLAAIYSDHADYDPAWALARSGAAATPREGDGRD